MGDDISVLNPTRSALVDQSGSGAERNPRRSSAFDRGADDAEQLATQKTGIVQVSAVIPQASQFSMIAQRSLSDGNQFRFAGAAARHGEHQDRLFGQLVRLAMLCSLYIGTQPFVVTDLDVTTVVIERANPIKAMVATEARASIAVDNVEEQLILDFPRLGGERVPASPVAPCDKRRSCREQAVKTPSVHPSTHSGRTGIGVLKVKKFPLMLSLACPELSRRIEACKTDFG